MSARHLLAIGESNIANHIEARLAVGPGRVHYEGQYSELRSPIPGGTGDRGSIWPRFAELAYNRAWTDDLTISLVAHAGAGVGDWCPGGKSHESILMLSEYVEAGKHPVTHIVYQQGERDRYEGTTRTTYASLFRLFYNDLRARFPAAPLVLCISSRMNGQISEPVRQAQMNAITELPEVYPGPDLDLLGESFRLDNTHLNASGSDIFADALLLSLERVP